MRKYILTLSLIVGAMAASAQIIWEKKDGPYGGSLSKIEISPNGNLFSISGDSHRIFKSSDNGINWSLVSISSIEENETVNDIKVAPDGTIYVVTSFSDFYGSVDDGANWTKLNTGTNSTDGGFDYASKIQINPTTGDILMMGNAGSDQVMYISFDGGVTWVVGGIISSSVEDFVVARFGTTGMIFVYGCCGSARVYASDDGGFNFFDVSSGTGLSDISINDMDVTPDGLDALLLTRNGIYLWNYQAPGLLAWIDLSAGLPGFFTNSGVVCTATDGTDTYLYFGDGDNNVLYRNDITLTGTWSTQHSNFLVNGSEAYDLVAKSPNEIFAVGRSIGLFRSANGGSAWIDSNEGIENQRFNDLILSQDGSRIIVAAEQNIYSSVNEGDTWTRFDLTGSTDFKRISSFIRLDNGDIYGYGNVSKVSTDNGVTWTDVANPFTINNDVRKVINSDQTRFFAINYNNNNEIAYSGDVGASWTAPIAVSGMPTSFNVDEMFVDADHNLYLKIYDYDISQRRLCKIVFNPDPGSGTPTGGTATYISNSVTGFTISNNNLETIFVRNNTLYALGRDGSGNWKLCISTDGGASFTSKNLNDGGYNLFVAPNGYILLATSDNNHNHMLMLSRDNGNTFVSTTIGYSFKGSIRDLALNVDTGIGYALLEYNGLYTTTGTIIIPESPTNVTEVGRGSTGLTIRFDDNALNEEGFVIQKEVAGVFVSLDTTGSMTLTGKRRYFQDRNLQPATQYNYRVLAYNSAGSSAFVPISVTTLPQTTPSIPDNRSWTGVTANIDGLAPPASNTTVGIKHLGNGFYSVTDVTAGTLQTVSPSLDPTYNAFFFESNGETYFQPSDGPIVEQQNGTWNGLDEITLFWRVDKDADPSYPDKYEQITFSLNASDPIPQAPENVRAYVYTSTSIEVSWAGTFYEQEFIIQRSTSSVGPFTEVDRIAYPSTRYIDDGTIQPLTLNTTYFYRVLAANSTGDSPPSAVSAGVTLTTPKFTLSNSVVSTASAGTGTGFIWADYDNDDDEDVILVQLTFFNGGESTPYAFRNDGAGVFTAVDAGFEASRYIIGNAADYDNDGNIDILMTTTATENLLYKGNGDFTFTKVSPNPVGENSQDLDNASLSAGWVDVDRNGRLDLFLANQGGTNTLYLQNPISSFTKITSEEMTSYAGQSNGHSWADYDNDGDMDVFIIDNSEQTTPNRLYKNNDDGTFTRVTGLIFDTDLDLGGFSTSWGDYDNDGDLDLFMGVQSSTDGNILYRNSGASGNYTFARVNASPVTDPKPFQTFGSAWGDIDNDGDLDLLTGNNSFQSPGSGTPNQIFINNGSGAFTQISNEKFNDATIPTFGVSFADFDKDGFLDVAAASLSIFTLQLGSPGVNSLLFKNNQTAGSSANWIQFKLIGTASNRSAIGARVTVIAGGKTQIREITSTTGFGGENSLIAHFGLGSSTSITSIQVRWPSGLIQNFNNKTINQVHELTEDGTGPAATALSPINTATNVSSSTKVSITFNEPATPVAGKLLLLYLNSDLSDPILGIDATDAVTTDNLTYEFTISPKLLAGTQYNISVDAGAFLDEFGNPSLEFPTGLWTFTTGAGPVVSALAPLNSATAVTTDAELRITFNENIFAVAARKIIVMDGATALVDLNVSSSGTISTNTYTLPAPTGGWPFNTTLEVIVDAGAFTDADENDFAGIATGSWTFTTVDAPDETPPVITFTPLSSTLEKGFTPIAIEATVVDNKIVTAVNFHHRKISEKNFIALPMTFNNGTGKWNAQVPNTFTDDMGFEYFLEARDGTNTGRLPLDNTTYFKSIITFTGANAPTLTLPSGGTKNSWKIISIPHGLPANQISTIFSQLGTADNTKWRMIRYTNSPAEAWQEYPTSFTTVERGKGYFINTKDGGSVQLSNATAPLFTRDNLFQMSLVPGFNQIGNPYTLTVNWADVKAYNPTAQIGDLVKFNSGSYTDTDQQLLTLEGGFVEAQTAVTIDIPFPGQNVPGGGRKNFSTLGQDISADEWALKFSLSQGELNNTMGAIGMALDANASFDAYDGSTPPRFFDYLEMNFNHPEHFAKRFTRDIVPTQRNHTWDFTVDTNIQGYAQLNWDNMPISGSGKDLFLLDISTNRLINMKQTGSYLFDPKVSSNFRVYFGENLKIAPEQIHLGNAYPNPTSGYTTIAFSLPETGGTDQRVTLDIMDAMGRAVGKITEGRYNPGFHEKGFDAKQLNNGFYTYRLTVQGKQGSTTQVNKLIIK